MGLVAPRHVGSSGTRARTRVPCIGRQILNHCATREVPTGINSEKLFTKWGIQVSGCIYMSELRVVFRPGITSIQENLKATELDEAI